MPATYTYRVRDRFGKVVEGSLEADSTRLVVEKLRQLGFTPLSIEEKAESSLSREIKIPGFGGKVKQKDIAVFSRQFATMINSGLSLLRSLNILAGQTENPVLAKIVGELRQDVERGASLSQALGKHPKAFNRLFVAMVRAGETGGVLDSVLLQLSTTIEKQVELRRKIKSAMTYPVVVFMMVIGLVGAMLLFVVPTFESIYAGLGSGLPLPTLVLLKASRLLGRFFPFLVLGGFLGAWGFRRWIGTEGGRARWDAFKLKVPVFGVLVHKTALARFAQTLAVLLKSGVPILESLEITQETVGNWVMANAIRDVQVGVRTGESIARPLANHAVFPAMTVQMLAVGEETGALDVMLEKVGEFYDQEVEATVAALTSLIEPLLIVVMGITVGGMVVALYMPMFNIINLVE